MKLSGEQRRTAFLLISPAVIVLLAINLFPIVYALYISFHHWTLARPQPPRFVGMVQLSRKRSTTTASSMRSGCRSPS